MLFSVLLLAFVGPAFVMSDLCGKTCEHFTAFLQCPEKSVIVVEDALYGRNDDHTCNPFLFKGLKKDCGDRKKSLAIVKKLCNYKRSCSVKASNQIFGDPCVGTYKYLDVKYKCGVNGQYGPWSQFSECTKSCGGGVQYRVRKCDKPAPSNGGQPCQGPAKESKKCNTQSCAVDGKWGSWGRFTKCTKSCAGGIQHRYRKCNKPAPKHGGKKCVGVSKQSKRCNVRRCPLPAITKVACEWQTLNIICPDRRTVEIMHASYGRNYEKYCYNGFLALFWNKRCHSHRSKGAMAARCNRKHHCSVSATNHVFGDPCFGTFKFLKVSYRCW